MRLVQPALTILLLLSGMSLFALEWTLTPGLQITSGTITTTAISNGHRIMEQQWPLQPLVSVALRARLVVSEAFCVGLRFSSGLNLNLGSMEESHYLNPDGSRSHHSTHENILEQASRYTADLRWLVRLSPALRGCLGLGYDLRRSVFSARNGYHEFIDGYSAPVYGLLILDQQTVSSLFVQAACRFRADPRWSFSLAGRAGYVLQGSGRQQYFYFLPSANVEYSSTFSGVLWWDVELEADWRIWSHGSLCFSAAYSLMTEARGQWERRDTASGVVESLVTEPGYGYQMFHFGLALRIRP